MTATTAPEKIGLRFLWIGIVLFLLSSFFILSGSRQDPYGPDFSDKLTFTFFALTHVANSIAALFLFKASCTASRSIFWRTWIGLLSLAVILFAVFSLLHFSSIALEFKELENIIEEFLALYFYLLPLQAIVFFLLLISLTTLRWFRKKHHDANYPSSTLLLAIFIFFILALFAIGLFSYLLGE